MLKAVMATRSNAVTQLLGAIAAALALAGGTASAQTIAKPDQRGATTAAAKPAQPVRPAQPAKSAKPAPVSATAPNQGTDYWAINTDVGRYRETKPIPAPRDPSRVPLQGAPGSVGFASGTVKTGQFADGREAPGLERYNQDPQSYAGMSFSVTSSNKSFPLPTQLLPHNQW
jgi:hypothetical protein